MTITIAIAIIVLLLMTLIMFFLLKKEFRDIDNKGKVYFTRKSQEYTDSLVSRDDSKPSQASIDNSEKKDNEDNNSQVIYVEKKANYEIDHLLRMMKQIDNKFVINNKKIIQQFIDKYVKNDDKLQDRFEKLQKMKEYINNIGIFDIITNDDESFIDNIKNELRLIDEDIFVEYYSDKVVFDVEDYCNFLDYEMGKTDPTVYVYVGNKSFNYDDIDSRVKTIYSDEIYKGLKIVYLNKLYDFSLS